MGYGLLANGRAVIRSLVAIDRLTVGDGAVPVLTVDGDAGSVVISGPLTVDTVALATPIANIPEATGGGTVDTQARAAIALLIAGLQSAGLIAADTVPAAPTDLIATPGDTTASIAFTPPADGGSAITDYEYRVGTGAWTTGATTASPVAIAGLANDVEVSITLRAVNAVGNSPASAAVLVTPAA